MRRSSHDWRRAGATAPTSDRKSTRLNSSHLGISYAVFCLKKKNGRGGPRPGARGGGPGGAAARPHGGPRHALPPRAGLRVGATARVRAHRLFWHLRRDLVPADLDPRIAALRCADLGLVHARRRIAWPLRGGPDGARQGVRDVLALRRRPLADPLRLGVLFFFNDSPTPKIYTLSLHDALPI